MGGAKVLESLQLILLYLPTNPGNYLRTKMVRMMRMVVSIRMVMIMRMVMMMMMLFIVCLGEGESHLARLLVGVWHKATHKVGLAVVQGGLHKNMLSIQYMYDIFSIQHKSKQYSTLPSAQ